MDNFEAFDVKAFVSRLGMGDLAGFMDKIHEVVPMEQQHELLQKLSEGNFTMRIMYEQFQYILKMGPINQVFSMLPRFSSELMPKGGEKESEEKIKRYMTMMDSMTNKDAKPIFFGKRTVFTKQGEPMFPKDPTYDMAKAW